MLKIVAKSRIKKECQEQYLAAIKTEHFTTILPTLKDFVEESLPAEFYTECEI